MGLIIILGTKGLNLEEERVRKQGFKGSITWKGGRLFLIILGIGYSTTHFGQVGWGNFLLKGRFFLEGISG